MHYTEELSVPANTSSGSPASTTVVLPAGVLESISIFFPPGCSKMVYIAIFDGATQVYPKTAGQSYVGDGNPVEITDMVIYDSAKTLTLKGWSPNTNYPHVVTFTFCVMTAEEKVMAKAGYY